MLKLEFRKWSFYEIMELRLLAYGHYVTYEMMQSVYEINTYLHI